MRIRVGVANFFWGQSIGIDETNTTQLTFFSSMEIVGATGLGGLLTLEWAWQTFRSIGINKTNTFQLKFLYSVQIVGTTDLGGLWTLKWALNLYCVQGYGI